MSGERRRAVADPGANLGTNPEASPGADPGAHPVTDDTRTLRQRFAVEYAFPVCFTRDLFAPANPLLRDTLAMAEPRKRHRFVAFVDEGVLAVRPELPARVLAYAAAHPARLEPIGAPVPMPGGERVKSEPRLLERMQRVLVERHVDRHSYVLGIGGGALLDAVGFVAATSHRGVRHVRVPTRVLSQNDSGVGVKNGVNLFGQKNYLGTFAPPFAVLNDHDFIAALPARERVAGIAEAVKVALIRDAALFAWLERHADALRAGHEAPTRDMIERCAALHMRQIGRGGDPFERGSARPLDYGHWSAHRLETLSGYRLRHGEAVAVGIALDTRYSVACGLLGEGADERVSPLLERLGLPLWHPALESVDAAGERELLRGLTDFREHLGGELTITLLAGIGRGVEVHAMDGALIGRCVAWLKARAATAAAR